MFLILLTIGLLFRVVNPVVAADVFIQAPDMSLISGFVKRDTFISNTGERVCNTVLPDSYLPHIYAEDNGEVSALFSGSTGQYMAKVHIYEGDNSVVSKLDFLVDGNEKATWNINKTGQPICGFLSEKIVPGVIALNNNSQIRLKTTAIGTTGVSPTRIVKIQLIPWIPPTCEGLQIYEYTPSSADIYNQVQTKIVDNTNTQVVDITAGKRYLVGVNLTGRAEQRDVGFAVVRSNSQNCSNSGDTVYSKKASSSTRGNYALYDDGGRSVRSIGETHFRFNWTPTVTGRFTVDGRVWDDGITEAAGNCSPGASITDTCQGVTCARVYSPNCKVKVNVVSGQNLLTPTPVPRELVFNGSFSQVGTTTTSKTFFTGWGFRGEDGVFYVEKGGNTSPEDINQGKFPILRSPVRVTTDETTTRFVQEIGTSLDTASYKFNFKVKNYLTGIGNTLAVAQLIKRGSGEVVGFKAITTADFVGIGNEGWKNLNFSTNPLPVAGNYNFRVFVYGGSQIAIDDVVGYKCTNSACPMEPSNPNIITNGNFETTTEQLVPVIYGRGWGRGQDNWVDRFAVIREGSNNYLYFATQNFFSGVLSYRYEQEVPLQAGKTYMLKAKAAVFQNNGDGVRVSVDYASGAVNAAPTLSPNYNISNSNLNFTQVVSLPNSSTYTDLVNSLTNFTEKEATFQVPASGNYYVRILVENGSIASLDDISLKEVGGGTDNCSKKAQGDTPESNGQCNGVINIADFARWKDAYLLNSNNAAVDFNGDGSVNISDFAIWKDGYLTTNAN